MKSSGHERENLVNRAREASGNAYAPYSRFPVGAAVADSSGRVFVGCNVENASFGLTQCAERNAMAAAIAAGTRPGELHIMLVYSPRGDLTPPCGACRQVMLEMLAPDAVVIGADSRGQTREWQLSALLPDPFLPHSLGIAT